MKKLIILICVLFHFTSANASHAAGGELTYKCLGNGVYFFTYTFYRDCFGIPAPVSLQMSVDNNCNFPTDTVTLWLNSATPTQIIPHCSYLTTCDGGNKPGIQKYMYEGTYVLAAECDWTFAVAVPARNGTITMSQWADAYDLYVTASLSNVSNRCNNSPVFNYDPVIFLCIGQPYRLDLSVTDLDDDSLSYSLIAPKTGANQTLPYNPGYSIMQPLHTTQPIGFNSSSGEIILTTTTPEVATYAIQVNSYKNGILTGQIERDIILYTFNCSEYQPMLSGVNGTDDQELFVYAYNPVCFSIFSSDYNSGDSTKLNWDHNIPSASLMITGQKNETAYFCWTPDSNDISSIPHCFTAYVTDNSCPANQSFFRTYCISVYDTVSGYILNSNTSLSSNDILNIFPQPANDIINFDFGELSADQYYLCIDNIYNSRVYKNRITSGFMTINNTELFKNGIYSAYVTDKNGNILKISRLIILNSKH